MPYGVPTKYKYKYKVLNYRVLKYKKKYRACKYVTTHFQIQSNYVEYTVQSNRIE